MDINNNQQVNSFLKGMNTDMSDALIDNSLYRYAENLRLVTNTAENDGELRMVEGTGEAIEGPWGDGEILAMTAIRNYLIVIAETSYEENGSNQRGVSFFTNTNKGKGLWRCIVKNIPYNDFVQAGETKPHFSLVSRWESANNIKLYIADGVRQIVCLNITKTYYDENNPFAENNTIQNIAPYTSTELHVPYVDIITGGRLKVARVQYAYRLYNVGEPASNVSPLSEIKSIYKTDNTGYRQDDISNKAAKVTIPNLSSDFDKLLLFRITYTQIGQMPTVELCYDGEIKDTIIDTGAVVESMSTDEFLSYITTDIIPKVIESKNDYMFAANLQYSMDNFDEEFEIGDYDFRAYSSGDYDDESKRTYNRLFELYNIDSYNIENWKVKDENGKEELGGNGPIIKWRYDTKRVLVDKDNNVYEYVVGTSTPIVKITEAITSLKRGEVYRYGIIFYNEKGLKSSVKFIADIMIPDRDADEFDPDSKYFTQYYSRPKNPFYDGLSHTWVFTLYGIKFYVGAHLIPDCKAFEIVRCIRTFDDSLTISQGIIGNPVRVYTTNDYTKDKTQDTTKSEYICPTGILTTQNIYGSYLQVGNNECRSVIDRNYLIFASPEIAYQPDDIKNVLDQNKSSIYIKDVQTYYHRVHKSWILSWPIDSDFLGVRAGTVEMYLFISNAILNNTNSIVLGATNTYSSLGDPIARVNIYNKLSLAMDFALAFLQKEGKAKLPTGITNIGALETDENYNKTNISIKNYAIPEVADPQHFYDDNKIALYKGDITPIGDSLYVGWTVSHLMGRTQYTDEELYDLFKEERNSYAVGQNSHIYDGLYSLNGIGGICAVFELSNEYPDVFTNRNMLPNELNSNIAPITISNLRKIATPYNGPDSYLNNSPGYYSFGNYIQKLNNEFTPITVYNGDSFPGLFIYNSSHSFDTSKLISAARICTVYYVPVECDMDLRATYGDLYTRLPETKAYNAQYKAAHIDDLIQENDMYLYNTAYHAEPNIISSTVVNYESIYHGLYDTRIHYSNVKTNGESIDSWTQFQPLNFLDVDSRFGEITNMRLFKDSLLYWQKNAAGILSVNERSITQDISGTNIILGTGGVLDRYDYISTVYGMKRNQYEAEIQSETTLYWWDGTNKEILGYVGGRQVTPLAKVKSLRNYINENEEQDKPTLIYNNKFDEIVCSVVTDNSLVYNERVLVFTSIYTMMPQYRSTIDNTVIITNRDHLFHVDSEEDNITLLGQNAYPLLRYVINKENTFVKAFDISTFGGRFYKGDEGLSNLTFTFKTPLKQESTGTGLDLITNREYDFRLDIPRNDDSRYGDRMRGKTMQCELKSSSNSNDFSLQYIITKYRMSWS